MNPHNKKKTIRSKYNATADFYNNRYRNIQYEKYSRMLNSMELKGMILDLGSGTGMLSDFLDKEVIGVDFSINMLKKSGNKYKILGDAENLPFKNNIFDFVLSFTLLQNLPGFKVFKEVERILKPDSLFILTTLKKKYMKKVYKILEKNFLILKEIDCGEDIGFICRKTYK
jgi:malonyl-CoA O-methyltransferase